MIQILQELILVSDKTIYVICILIFSFSSRIDQFCYHSVSGSMVDSHLVFFIKFTDFITSVMLQVQNCFPTMRCQYLIS